MVSDSSVRKSIDMALTGLLAIATILRPSTRVSATVRRLVQIKKKMVVKYHTTDAAGRVAQRLGDWCAKEASLCHLDCGESADS